MTVNKPDGSTVEMSKTLVVTILVILMSAMGSGGVYVGIQASKTQYLEAGKTKTDSAIEKVQADIATVQTDIAVIKSKQNWNTHKTTSQDNP